MNKYFSKIITGLIVLGIFLMPINLNFKESQNNGTEVAVTINQALAQESSPASPTFGCSWNPTTWLTSCLLSAAHSLIFTPLAYVTVISAKFLDFFIYYSTNSDSYDNPFVSKGWAAVRDFANIFFILGLLYVAIKTILDLHGPSNKQLISFIIMAALMINFSLFTSKVVIDSSNILAKIFYNNIKPQGPNGEALPAGTGGQRSITVGLAQLFKANNLFGISPQDNLGVSFLIMVLCIMLMLYMIFVFVSVGVLFIARTVALWLYMIFSPLAFASYAVPFDIPGFGHKEWWSELLKNAFLAPIFIFFLYIILLFGDLLSIVNIKAANASDWKDSVLASIIPFAILFILLQQAKKLAVKYSGEIGGGVMSAAKSVGGFVGGAALGAVAFGGSRVLGGGAELIKNTALGRKLNDLAFDEKEELKKGVGGFLARQSLRGLDKTSKSSFDLRQGAVGKQLVSATGLDLQSSSLVGLGSKAGGFKGAIERRQKANELEAESMKTTMTNDQVKAMSDKKKKEYEEGLAQAERIYGEDGVKKYKAEHKEPEYFNTAEELNNARLKSFRNNLGYTGLLGSLAYSATRIVDKKNFNSSAGYREVHREEYIKSEEKKYKEDKERAEGESRKQLGDKFDKKLFDDQYNRDHGDQISKDKLNYKYDLAFYGKDLEFDKSIADAINKRRMATAKMIIGGGAAVLAGGAIGGSVVGGILGATGGGISGAGLAYSEKSIEDKGDAKYLSSFDKNLKKLNDIDTKIAKINETLEGHNNVFKKAKDLNLTIDVNGKTKINKEALSLETSKKEIEISSFNTQLTEVDKGLLADPTNQTLISRKETIVTNLSNAKVALKELTNMDGIEEKIANAEINKKNYEKERAEALAAGPAPLHQKVDVNKPSASHSDHGASHAPSGGGGKKDDHHH